MKPYAPKQSNKWRTASRDDIHRKTADQSRQQQVRVGKSAKHAARQEGSRIATEDSDL
ncbi:hypothetical protein [Neptuniibacter sp. QD37_11]|uniref:hypothetical protein n=1 Tax=Neptuniibacter sp. QD37_11 TaxID=3398209 RepID=UPI0039F5EBE2